MLKIKIVLGIVVVAVLIGLTMYWRSTSGQAPSSTVDKMDKMSVSKMQGKKK